ncbi:uncharacterized protein HMPREF1541_06041 [Cyphellophora europaea CBS 101466]|uniref:F-box domain-containing protein n=1 Tax=Cyphellophora europaea (strain CBS 101466) TaxID=1220924 RepID=W2RU22_CYPE1|nr:uncharacterized protein HMPREF1541_06041 [Cyphellophora europaea CBS 101466]ETN39815.1 hypothetical protein HMPREF1541_06041 [Cyphellophora europaea CBS 101466]
MLSQASSSVGLSQPLSSSPQPLSPLSNQPRSPTLLSIPAEIRTRIYQYVFDGQRYEVNRVQPTDTSLRGPVTAILQACSLTYREALSLLAPRVTVVARTWTGIASLTHFKSALIPKDHVRRLEVDCGGSASAEIAALTRQLPSLESLKILRGTSLVRTHLQYLWLAGGIHPLAPETSRNRLALAILGSVRPYESYVVDILRALDHIDREVDFTIECRVRVRSWWGNYPEVEAGVVRLWPSEGHLEWHVLHRMMYMDYEEETDDPDQESTYTTPQWC